MKRYLSLWFMAFIPFMLIAQNNGNGAEFPPKGDAGVHRLCA